MCLEQTILNGFFKDHCIKDYNKDYKRSDRQHKIIKGVFGEKEHWANVEIGRPE